MSQALANKVALVTGGSSGLGLATAKRFAAEGAHVFITGRRKDVLDAAAKDIGSNATPVQGDTSNLADLDRLFETIKKEKGHLDIVFANAGGGEFAPLGHITEEHFDKTFNTNVKGVVFTVQKSLPLLRPGASIILNASAVSNRGLPAFGVYAATKAALRSFTRTWANDLRGKNIRVNTLSPGLVPTPGYSNLGVSTDADLQNFINTSLPGIPLGRPGTPEEVAASALFLASSESSYITGIELFVDGGMSQT